MIFNWLTIRTLLVVGIITGCVIPVDQPAQILTTTPPLVGPSTPLLATASQLPVIEPTLTAAPTGFSPTPTVYAASFSNYTLKTLYNPAAHHLAVVETIQYFNRSPVPIPDLLLVVEANRTSGVFQLDAISWESGEKITDYSLSSAILTIPLAQPLLPEESLSLKMTYQIFLPERTGTLGFTARQANLGEWYPYLPVYQPGAGWLVHNSSGLGEYLAYDIANFQAEIKLVDAAEKLIIAANAPASGSPETGYSYRLDQARNFVWSASPRMELIEGLAGPTRVQVYVFPEDVVAGQASLKIIQQALAQFGERFGAYPHPSLTLVEGSFFDGMEYDGLFFLDQSYFTEYVGGVENYLATLTAHETAHQWWFGLVGSDQALEPWLDESLCTYSELIFYQHYYPAAVNWWWDFRIQRFHPSGWVNSTIYQHAGFRPYVDAVYLRGALFLHALRLQVGDETFFAFLKDYATRYRYGWTSGADFFNVLGDHTQVDLSSVIDAFFQRP